MYKYRTHPLVSTFLATLFFISPLAACVTQKPESQQRFALGQSSSTPQEVNASLLDANLLYQIMVGELDYTEGNFSEAYFLILNAARQSKSDQLFERAVQIAVQAKVLDSALDAAQEWQKINPTAKDAYRYILDILISNKQYAQMKPSAQALIRLTPDADRPGFITAMGQYFSAHAQDIDPYYEAILEPWLTGSNTEERMASWVSISLLKLSASKLEEAYTAVENAHKTSPQSIEPLLAAVGLIDNSIPQAEDLVLTYLKDPTASPQVRLAYTQTLLQQQRINLAMQQLETAITHPDTPPVAWFILGSLQLETKHTATGMQILQTYLDKTQEDYSPEVRSNRERTYLELAQAEADLNQIEAAQKWLNQISTPEIKTPALKSYIGMLMRAEKYDLAFQVTSQIPATTIDEHIQKISLQAQILIQAKRWREAFDLLDKANAAYITAPQIELLYLQALSAEKIGNFTKMETLLRQVISINPNHAYAYNALGFFLADQNKRLPEARSLIEKALEIDPKNPIIIDSMGWLEYRLGNSEKALALLQTSHQQYPDPEVAAHLGEVQWVLGQHDNAMTTWKLAWIAAPDNQDLQRAFKKFRITQTMLNNFTLSSDALGTTPSTSGNTDAAAHNVATYITFLMENKEWQKLYDLLAPMTQKAEIPALMHLQAHAAEQLNNHEEAEKILRRSIELEPDNATTYNDLGYMFAARGERLEEAKALIEKANELNPDNPAILDSLGWVEFKLGNSTQALKWLETAYEKDPSIAEIGIHLGEVLWDSNRKAEALLIWRDVQFRHPANSELQEALKRLNVILP